MLELYIGDFDLHPEVPGLQGTIPLGEGLIGTWQWLPTRRAVR